MDVWRSRLDNIYNFIRKISMVNFLYFSDFVWYPMRFSIKVKGKHVGLR